MGAGPQQGSVRRLPTRGHRERWPAWPAAAALAAGMIIGRRVDWSGGVWMAIAVLALLIALRTGRRRPRRSTAAICAALACVGGLRQHLTWSIRGPHDIAAVTIPDNSPARLIGVIDSPVEIRSASASAATPGWLLLDRSSCVLRCEALRDGTAQWPVTGRVRLTVNGHLLHVREGDRVEALGRLAAPAPPRLSADFDYTAWLRAQGIDRVLQADHPEAVQFVADAAGFGNRWGRMRARLRDECERVLTAALSSTTRFVGTSLLLGTRADLPEEVRQNFARSGMMHVLAISGLHVGILAACLFFLSRLFGCSTALTAGVLVAGIWSYASMTDLRPPVLRAAILGSLSGAAMLSSRRGHGLNLLCATAFALLLWSPGDLFDVGAQLSFLAVAAIVCSAQLSSALRRRPPADRIILESDRSAAQRRLRAAGRWLRDAYLATAAIWLFTLPLALARFHLASPIGFLINVALLPCMVPLLACGFCTLAAGLLWPPLAIVPAFAYDRGLRGLLIAVEAASRMPGGHWTAAGPSSLWLAGFYVLLAVAVLARTVQVRRWAWRSLSLCVTIPLLAGLWPVARHGLCCTWVDVGHGGAVLIELPQGRTLLFDAGAFGDEKRALRPIEDVLWRHDVRQVDGLLISHADVDHFNAARGLLDAFPVGAIFCSPTFLDFQQASVVSLCEAASRGRVPLRLVQAGDRLIVDDGVDVRVLHPAGNYASRLDNANSLVIQITYAGRTILLTGDIEEGGLQELLRSPSPAPIDVLHAPHHGGKSANTRALADWSLPRVVTVSTNDLEVGPRLAGIYRDAEQILTTAQAGEILVHIAPDGDLQVAAPRP